MVGNQSSGKSSVLQAITRLPFPVSDKMCTRFPTEVSQQRSSGPTRMSFTIKPDDAAPDFANRIMLAWRPSPLEDIESMSEIEFSERFAQLLKEVSEPSQNQSLRLT